MKRVLVGLIKAYKAFISPYIVRSCRHTPTCSEYAVEALERFGIFRGAMMSIWRILRCNPFSRTGFDPVVKPRTGRLRRTGVRAKK